MIIYMLDDSKTDLILLKKAVDRYGKEMAGVDFVIQPFLKGEELVRSFQDAEEKPYLIFLDIFMEDENGIEVAKKLRALGCDSRIIFATSSETHMMDAFEVYADGYICKPFKFEDVKNAMDRMKVRFMNESKSITVRADRSDLTVKVADIVYAESGNHVVTLHLNEETIKIQNTLGEMAELLAEEKYFITCGRSFLVNLNYVDEVTKDEILLKNGDGILIPVRLRKQIADDFNRFRLG